MGMQMAHTMWSGSITFGLVSVPVRLHTAIGTREIDLHEYDARSGDRIRIKKVNESSGMPVDSWDIVKGTEEAGVLVTVTQAELDAMLPAKSKSINVEAFVHLDEIDPLHFGSSYNLSPGANSDGRGYALIAAVLADRERAAVVTWTMRNRPYLGAIRAVGGRLILHSLNWSSSIRAVDDISYPDPIAPEGIEYDSAVALVEAYAAKWQPEQYRNSYTSQVAELFARKRSEVQQPEEIDTVKEVEDLLAELERAVA